MLTYSDEAHRLNEKSRMFDNQGENQIMSGVPGTINLGIVSKIMKKSDVIQFIIDNGKNKEIVHWLSQALGALKALPV